MAIYQGVCASFKQELFEAIHDLEGDTLKVALYEDSASLSPNTTAYTASGEVSEAGYDAGGAEIAATMVVNGQSVEFTFATTEWASEITARGALIYNASKANRAIVVLNFGIDRSSVDGTFTLTCPAAGSDFPILKMP